VVKIYKVQRRDMS